MIKKIGIIGSTGLLGRPVAAELIRARYEVKALVRNRLRNVLPTDMEIIYGDLKNHDDVQKLFQGCDAVYINLSIKQNEKSNDWHAETDGVKVIIAAAKNTGIQHITMISSLVQRYQGVNGFSWWAFECKHEAVRLIKESGIPTTIFYPSTFMENFVVNYRQGNNLLVAGKSDSKQFFIAAADYAKQVARSFQLNPKESREYIVQGLEAFTTEEACEVFKANYRHQNLSIIKAPHGVLKFLGKFIQTINYGAHIIEALNKYPEKFESEKTWEDLGKPTITLKEFAASL